MAAQTLSLFAGAQSSEATQKKCDCLCVSSIFNTTLYRTNEILVRHELPGVVVAVATCTDVRVWLLCCGQLQPRSAPAPSRRCGWAGSALARSLTARAGSWDKAGRQSLIRSLPGGGKGRANLPAQ